MGLKYYFSSVAGNMDMKKNQQKMEMILDSKKIEYQKIDIASNEDAKQKMKEMMGDPKGLAPQLFSDDTYLGGFKEFYDAVEAEDLMKFLKM